MLPQTPEARSKLNQYLSECVEYLSQKDVLDEDIKNIKEIVFEELDIKKADFTQMVNVAYDRTKVEGEISKRQTAIDSVDIITKG